MYYAKSSLYEDATRTRSRALDVVGEGLDIGAGFTTLHAPEALGTVAAALVHLPLRRNISVTNSKYSKIKWYKSIKWIK